MSLARALDNYVREREDLQDSLGKYQDDLVDAKGRTKRALKKNIRKTARALRKIERLIKQTQRKLIKEGKNDIAEVLAEQGIDQKSNFMKATSDMVVGVAKEGAKIASGIKGGGSIADESVTFSKREQTEEPNNNMLYILGGVGVLAYFLMSKKK